MRKTAAYLALFLMTVLTAFTLPLRAQSTDQSFPSPVTSGELTGTIPARDVGDARLTTYFYVFDAGQGDLFVNFLTKNFTGDIDIFIQDGLRPLSKIVMYADLAETETGRVLYLRKAERLMMRIQGRTPGDDPATFKIKFAGSFQAISDPHTAERPEAPKVTSTPETNVRVNSVGTILEVIPKTVPVKTEEVADAAAAEDEPVEKKEAQNADTTEAPKKVEVVVSDNIPPANNIEASPPVRTSRRRRGSATAPNATRERTAKAPPPPVRRSSAAKTTPPETPADPMANIQLVIEFKDGRTIRRPMSEVFRFTVDRGQLTVISKDGSIGRYTMLDVAAVTIK
jgi:hypothetical protein